MKCQPAEIWVESTLGKADKRLKDFDAENSFVS